VGRVYSVSPATLKMDPKETIGRTYYNSIYRHGVDGKRRIQIPAKWRPAEPGTELTVVLWLKAKEGPCLRVMPPEIMAALSDEIDAMPSSDPSKGVLKRLIGSGSVQVSLDKTGRICVPEEMAREAGIESDGQVVLVGCLDRFEIWNPERHKQIQVSDAVMAPEAFKLME
jgi:MraZ protein